MKITKTQLKRIIKEELSNITEGGAMGHYEETSDQMDASSINLVNDQVREATTLFADLYNGLPDDESKELFEEYFNANVQLYTKEWRKERSAGPEDWRSTPDLPEELP